MRFRPGLPADADSLSALANEASNWHPSDDEERSDRQRLRARLANPDVWCQVAEDDGKAIGYVALTPAWTSEEPGEAIPGLGHLWHLFVSPPWWGSGVAPRLLSAAVEEASRRGYEAMNLWAPRRNARALAFYEREGWRATGAERRSQKSNPEVELVEYRRALPG
jgi:GNAT superfamily N-acetyltransferase